MSAIIFNLPSAAGLTGLTLEVYTVTEVLISASPVSVTETSAGVFTATIPETLEGTSYALDIKDSSGNRVGLVGHRAGALVPTSNSADAENSDGGYEFTGGFADRTTGTAGASDVGSNVLYTQDMVNASRWLRFGFDSAQQVTNDSSYWTNPTPAPTSGVHIFLEGKYFPALWDVQSGFGYLHIESSTYLTASYISLPQPRECGGRI